MLGVLIVVLMTAYVAADADSRGCNPFGWAGLVAVTGPVGLGAWLIARRWYPRGEARPRHTSTLGLLATLSPLFLLSILIFVCTTTFVFQAARVQGAAMGPTIMDQDRLIVNRLTYRYTDPRVGDIVMLNYPLNPERSFVKRVIAEEGNSVQLRDGQVYLDGQLLNESYVAPEFRSHDNWGPQVVPGRLLLRARRLARQQLGQPPLGLRSEEIHRRANCIPLVADRGREEVLGRGLTHTHERFVRHGIDFRVLQRDDARVIEAGIREQPQPVGAIEETLDVAIVLDADGSVRIPHDIRIVHDVGRVGRVGIPHPFQIPEATRRPVMAAVIGHRRTEILPHEVRCEERNAAWLAVGKGGFDRLLQVGFRRHVTHGVVDEHRVELTPEAHGPHVALDVLAFRIERAADREHAFGQIDEHHLEARFQVGSIAAAAAPELEHRPGRYRAGGDQRPFVERRFLGVVGWRRQERPP